MQPFVTDFIQRLADTQASDGSWSYTAKGTAYTEPTALAAMALAAHTPDHKTAHPAIGPALQWLTTAQNEDGSIGLNPDQHTPPWPTALAMLAWRWATPDPAPFQKSFNRAMNWLFTFKGLAFPRNPVTGHDTTLVGWPWIENTHSWIEPTAYAVLIAKSQGRSGHPRIREAVRLIIDRAVRTGGWNYGNNRVLTHHLRPFPACTGIALLALGGEPSDPAIQQAIDYLTVEVGRIRSPMSLSFSLMALLAWNRRPDKWADALQQAAAKAAQRALRPADLAYILLAAAGKNAAFVRATQTTRATQTGTDTP